MGDDCWGRFSKKAQPIKIKPVKGGQEKHSSPWNEWPLHGRNIFTNPRYYRKN